MNRISHVSNELITKYPALKNPVFGCKRTPRRLTQEEAQTIFDDPRTQKAIADEYGVTILCVGNIKRGSSWKQLKRPTECKPNAESAKTRSLLSWFKRPTLPTISWSK